MCGICELRIRRNRRVEHKTSRHVPVTVDVIRLCGCRTGSLIICSLAADAVDGVAITCISIETTLQVNIVCTEHHVEVVAV